MTQAAFGRLVYPNAAFQQAQGIGLTAQRRRDLLVAQLIQQVHLRDECVIQALRATPRHLFVDDALASRSYEDTALPIGFAQTISQPSVVAKMTQVLLQKGNIQRVLEIGTGSGYQTAILAQLIPQVWTTERLLPLQQSAQKVLAQLQLHNIYFRHTETELGWADAAPFDAILSAAAPESIPESLIAQLSEGGRMVIPVGGEEQELVVVDKTSTGIKQQTLAKVLFVPLIA